MAKILIALGGNALGDNHIEQQELVANAAQSIVKLIEKGHQIIICHGNGPQVGLIHQALVKEKMPLPECTAMSQGYIGYHLQKALRNELKKQNIQQKVISLVTQVIVDDKDPAFQKPTKPIGVFYDEFEAKNIQETFGYTMLEDAGRGYRRYVASPKPVDIVEKETLKDLIKTKNLIITSGGGGIPVVYKDEQLVSAEAVIDKDATAALVADLVDADILLVLTAIDYVMINFKKDNQKALKHINIAQVDNYIKENQFHKGSMLPKVEAARRFVQAVNSRACYITALENALAAIDGKVGTKITKA
ncbi:MAG: carbamate kinase [Breznakia sp.]